MAEKVFHVEHTPDYKTNLYYVSAEGHLMKRNKASGEKEIVHANAIQRDKNFMYFMDKDGDVARAVRGSKKLDPPTVPEL